MIEQIDATHFKTDDGMIWPTIDDAATHETRMQLEAAYNTARREFGEFLASTQKTADQHPFTFHEFTDYYYVMPGWAGRPQIQSVAFGADSNRGWGWSWTEEGEFIIRARDDRGKELEFPIGILFLKIENAERALVTALENWLEEQQNYLDAKRRALPKQ